MQRNSESRLLSREKEGLQCFLIDPNAAEEATVEQGAKEKPSLIEELQRKAAAVTAQSKTSATKYNYTNHVCVAIPDCGVLIFNCWSYHDT